MYRRHIEIEQNNAMSREHPFYITSVYKQNNISLPPHYAQTTLCHRNTLTFYWAEQSTVRNFSISDKAQLPTHHFRFVSVPLVIAYRTPLSVVKNFNVAYVGQNRGQVHYCFCDRNKLCHQRRPFAIHTDLRSR